MTTVVYFGTAPFAVPPLAALLRSTEKYYVAAVVSQPDRPAGRNGKIAVSTVAAFAREHHLLLLQPESLRDSEVQESLALLKPDLFLVAAYGKILPQEVLAIPRRGALNLHGSLLPKYRGASPIQAAILEGEAETGVTLMVMDDKMDHGPLIAEAKTAIAPDDTHASLERKLGEVAAALLAANLEAYLAGDKKPVPQDHDTATFTKILSREDGLVSWQDEDAARTERKTRAYDPWPGAYFIWNRNGAPLRIKIVRARVAADADAISKEGNPVVPTKKGALELLLVQPEGKKPMSGAAFMNGYRDFTDSGLS